MLDQIHNEGIKTDQGKVNQIIVELIVVFSPKHPY